MHARSELKEFVRFYHVAIELAVRRDPNKYDDELFEKYHSLSSFFIENYICRVSDTLDRYLESITAEVCRAQPNFLAEASYNAARRRLEKFIGDTPTEGEVIVEAAKTFCNGPKADIEKKYSEKIHFQLFDNDTIREGIQLLGLVRNAVVHADSVVDFRFDARSKALNAPFEIVVGQQLVIPERWALETALAVDEFVFSADHRISDFANIKKRDRRGHFWLRRLGTSTRPPDPSNSTTSGAQACQS